MTAQCPNDAIDPGPRAGRLPTDPMLKNGPVVNFALLNQFYPSGTNVRNTGDVFFDTPNRVQPHSQQFTAGFERQLGAALSASADYVHTIARDQWLLENLNPGVRVNTTASGAIVRVDPRRRPSSPGKSLLEHLKAHAPQRLDPAAASNLTTFLRRALAVL